MRPDRAIAHAERAAVWAAAVAVVVGFSLLLALQTPAVSIPGIDDSPTPDCSPSDTETTARWEPWRYQGDLPFGLYDPVLFVEPEREYPYRVLAAPRDGRMDLYKSKDMEEFTKVESDVEGAEFASNFNWGRKVDGRYYLFRTLREEKTELWTGDSLSNLTNRGVVLNESDTGGFYDPETETWHIYYQKAPAPGTEDSEFGPNTDVFVHATSKNAREWTRRSVALNVSDRPWKAGDPDVIKVDDRYYMFFDQTTNHPVYHIHLAVSKNLSSFTPVGRTTGTCGGDAVVRYLPTEGEFVMLTEYGGGDVWGIGVGTSAGPENRSYELDGRQGVIRTTNDTTHGSNASDS